MAALAAKVAPVESVQAVCRDLLRKRKAATQEHLRAAETQVFAPIDTELALIQARRRVLGRQRWYLAEQHQRTCKRLKAIDERLRPLQQLQDALESRHASTMTRSVWMLTRTDKTMHCTSS